MTGYVEKSTIPSGMHLKTLFAKATYFSLKTQLVEVTQDSPTSEGLIVELDGVRPMSGARAISNAWRLYCSSSKENVYHTNPASSSALSIPTHRQHVT